MKTLIKQIGFALIALTVSVGMIDAKPSSSSSSFKSSSSSFKSSGFGSSSKSYGTTGSSGSNSAKYNGSTPSKNSSSWASKPQTSTRPQSTVERSKYEAASKSGTVFKTRESAVADFKAKKATTYTSKFATEPTKRPDHIPQTYKANGTSYNITYNQNVGGYGYWNGGGPGLGSFLLYDLLQDEINLNRVMDSQHYYVGNAPVIESNSSSGWTVFWIIVCSALGIFLIYKWVNN
jgi:hypothetical protein